MELITLLLSLLYDFYHGILCAKTSNPVHGEACKVQHEICKFKVLGFKDTHNLLRMFKLHQTFTICYQSYVFDDSVIFFTSLNW